MKHGLNVLSYKHLALADLKPPIVVVVPFRSAFAEEEYQWLSRLAEPDMLAHGRTIFGREFSSVEELTDFSISLKSVEEVISAVKRPDRLLFDTEWTEPLEQQMVRAAKLSSGLFDEESAGFTILNQSVGRMMQANDSLMKSRELIGTPLMDAPTSWQYLNWKLEYSAEQSQVDQSPMHVVHSIQEAGGKRRSGWGRFRRTH